MIENIQLYPIGVIERDTGIGRDTLRVWECRYGFSKPVRNEKGERIHPEIQLRRRPRKRRLLDRGIRPGKLLSFTGSNLRGNCCTLPIRFILKRTKPIQETVL